ncbi:MAG: TetR/AcrR family transcriptional regulator, partial [Acutalibacteraceae bacterium]
MPTKRFYNLPDEKKQRIIKASVEELSSVNIDNLSINRIVKKAEIPRGSFYEYFENKFDLVDFLL